MSVSVASDSLVEYPSSLHKSEHLPRREKNDTKINLVKLLIAKNRYLIGRYEYQRTINMNHLELFLWSN